MLDFPSLTTIILPEKQAFYPDIIKIAFGKYLIGSYKIAK
jgi:hypothetical protein